MSVCLIYTFEGRKTNQTLGMLMTKRMEKYGLKPLSFSITDYGLSICSLTVLTQTAPLLASRYGRIYDSIHYEIHSTIYNNIHHNKFKI